ncbi:Hypothetical predicted protein [Octopus vulgaris]|uniref:Uncharacterized protein n=1 Tax=Octopus vulgaris TaxID=6645 RepID=A0AA36BLT6_OCTVU|nr:Hypothetical predicted protein [Octopus vulgaris]
MRCLRTISNIKPSDHIHNTELLQVKVKLSSDLRTAFAAVMFDETTDLEMKSQLSHILQFIDEKEMPQERFWGYVDVSTGRKAASLTGDRKFVNEFHCGQKFITQIGVNVKAGYLNSANKSKGDFCHERHIWYSLNQLQIFVNVEFSFKL